MDEYYNSIASGYNELHGEEQKKKMNIINQFIFIEENDRILDVGCGTGLSTVSKGMVIGVDPNIELLKQGTGERINSFGEELPFKDNTFDLVTCISAIHNYNDIKKGLDEIKRVSKNDIVISVLKRIAKEVTIVRMIKKNFKVIEEIDEEKDIIFILKCNNE